MGNNSRCSPEGKCNWVGDYASYQEHITACQNVPLCVDCADISVPEEPGIQSEEEPEEREEKETALSDSEGTTCPDAYAPEDSEAEDVASHSARPLQDVDHCAAEPAEAEEQSLTGLIQQLVELKAAQQLTSPKAAAVVEQKSWCHELERTSTPEEFAKPASQAPCGTSSNFQLPPGVFTTKAKAQEQGTAKRATNGEQRAGKNSKIEAARLAQAAQAAWAAQAAQWRELQWQAAQQNRMAYAGQVAQWQMAQAAQMQAARAAWLVQATGSSAASYH